jgi:hypothetical protein
MAIQSKRRDGLKGRRLRCGELGKPVETTQKPLFEPDGNPWRCNMFAAILSALPELAWKGGIGGKL